MVFARSFLLLLIASSSSIAASAESSPARTIVYTRTTVPPTWKRVDRADSQERMHFLVGVKQQNLDVLEASFWEVSNPKSQSWQHHMTREQIDQLVSSKPEDMDTVMLWLEDGLSKDGKITKSADSIELSCTVAQAEQLFET